MSVTVSDVKSTLHGAEPFDVSDTEAQADMTFIIGLPVFHEVCDVLDVHSRAWNLPYPSMTWPAATTGLTLVTSFLQELAP